MIGLKIISSILISSRCCLSFQLQYLNKQSRLTPRSFHKVEPSRCFSGSSSTKLPSLQKLMDELTIPSEISKTPRIVFVGGKGGVGKTSVSSALAVSLASNFMGDMKVLVVSTDPAHSLGDALDVDLKSSGGKPVQMMDPLTMGNLYAMEINTAAAVESFQEALATFDVQKLSSALGVQPEVLDGLGLSELSGVLKNPPPGLDELVSLSNILNDPSIADAFDIIIVDTAPTGHTLRMLALPEFLDGFLGKLLDLRIKLSGIANTLQTLLGGGNAAVTRSQTIDGALRKLEELRVQMKNLRKRLKDRNQTKFVVVTIPSTLSVNETKRLLTELKDQGINVSDLVVNQCVVGSDGKESLEAMESYYRRRRMGQDKWIMELQGAVDEVSVSSEYKSNGGGNIQLSKVPFFDVELVGTAALAYLGRSVFIEDSSFTSLLHDQGTKFVICGGKGGVGKTTTASSLAMAMAAEGRNVALVSTDPAHSLGDAFEMSFSGGRLCEVPLVGMSSAEGSLSVLEVDPKKALDEFKETVDKLIGSSNSGTAGAGVDLKNTLRDLGEIFDTLPAGTDEVIALAKVINLVSKGNFDRLVLDTAPTGHTLRLLTTPSFIAELIDKILAIAKRIDSNPIVKMMLSRASGESDIDGTAQSAKQALLSFQFQMYDLEELFSDAAKSEFFIVTIPTELAVRESIRLLNELTFEAPDMPIKVRHVIVNQVLSGGRSDIHSFLNRVAESQKYSLTQLKHVIETSNHHIEITEVSYLDTEPRGVYGLKALSTELIRNEEVVNKS